MKTPVGILLVMTVVTGVVDAVSSALGRLHGQYDGQHCAAGVCLAGARGLSISRSSVALIAFDRCVAGGAGPRRSGVNHWVGRGSGSAPLPSALRRHGFRSDAAIDSLHLYALIALTAMAMGLRNAVVRKLEFQTDDHGADVDDYGLAADAGYGRDNPAGSGASPRLWRCSPELSPALDW
jgi:hypothetical protein